MSQDFTKVSPAVWRSKRFLGLDDAGKVLYLYFLTCEHQNSTGCFRLPDAYASSDLAWPIEKYIENRSRLVDAGLVAADANESMIYVRRWFKHCPPTNANHAKGISRQISKIESDVLRELVEQDFAQADAERMAREQVQNRRPGNGFSPVRP